MDRKSTSRSDRPGSRLSASEPGRRPKLVHKLVFSMPPRTPPDKVLGAVRDFAREEFALKHRYAMVLHTDDEHPHVHVVVKAVSEQGERLNIRKDTLRRWRAEFARQLQARGVEANATERAVRGSPIKSLKDGIYRASERETSTHMQARVRAALSGQRADSGPRRMYVTNERIQAGYKALATLIEGQGERDLSTSVRRFAEQIACPYTEQQVLRNRMRGAMDRDRGRGGGQAV
jgi:hypothetical protein